MMMSNGMSLTEKQKAIQGFKEAAQDYGLDLRRMSLMGAPNALWDDGCLLVCAADERGLRPTLFNSDGTPSQEVLAEAAQSSPSRAMRRG